MKRTETFARWHEPTHSTIIDAQVNAMNELNQMLGTVSTIVIGFAAVVGIGIAIDLWAQRLSHRRCCHVIRAEAESYLRSSKRI